MYRDLEAEMSEPQNTERTPQEETEHPPGEEELESPGRVAGEGSSGYSRAGQEDREQRSNRPPSEQDEDQGI